MQSPRGISLFFLLLLFVVSSALYYPRYFQQKAMTAQLGALLSGQGAPLALGIRSRSSGCADNTVPDHECTPGSVFPDATPETICKAGYTKTVRSVSTKLRQTVYAEYGVLYPQPRGSYEVDHLIPLALGGNNDIDNLFLQPAAPAPGFREKDLVEVYLQEQVCAGRVALQVAQQHIADDWLSIYNKLAPDDIARLKAKYRNWSN